MWTTGALKGHFQRIGLKLLKEKSTNSYTSTGCQFVLFKELFLYRMWCFICSWLQFPTFPIMPFYKHQEKGLEFNAFDQMLNIQELTKYLDVELSYVIVVVRKKIRHSGLFSATFGVETDPPASLFALDQRTWT